MFLRSVLELSSRGSFRKIPRHLTSQQIPSFLASRKDFSASPQQNASPKGGVSGKLPEEAKGGIPVAVIGGVVVAGASLLAYRSGYLDQFIRKEQNTKSEQQNVKENQSLEKSISARINEEINKPSFREEQAAAKVGEQTGLPHAEAEQKIDFRTSLPGVETEQKFENHAGLAHSETEQKVDAPTPLPGVDSEQKVDGHTVSPHVETEQKVSPQQETLSETESMKHLPVQTTSDTASEQWKMKAIEDTEVQTQYTVAPEKKELNKQPAKDRSEASMDKGIEVDGLFEAYHLKGRAGGTTASGSAGEQALLSALEELNDGYITKDGKLVMDFLQAIHAAEKRQAELDALAFAEERRTLKAKYEKELRDSRARELMHAEEVALLDKELKREKAKAAAAIAELQEKMEEKLRMELEQKENEAEIKVQRIQELAKAELAAAIAKEKADNIQKIADANINIDALCMAFFARSEEARQIYSVHKVALGALALEDALSKGQPIQQELDDLNAFLEGNDKESLVHLVLSTLPEETKSKGTDTVLQLNQKFKYLKGALRHYILIPPGGSGILPHALSRIASWLRIKEVDPSGEGIESIISRVDGFLAEGKLSEAAEALQEGVRGSEAEEIIKEWVKQARNRVITEQALIVLQSYATGISLTQ